MRTFSIRDVLSFAREHTLDGIKKVWATLAVAYCIILVVTLGAVLIETIGIPLPGTYLFRAIQTAVFLVPQLVAMYVIYVLARVFVPQWSSTTLKVDTPKKIVEKIVYYLLANVLVLLAFIIGLVLLIVPGFYILFRLSLFPFFVFIENKGIIKSLGDSFRTTQGNVGKLALFYLAITCIVILVGVIPSFALLWLIRLYLGMDYALIIYPPLIHGMMLFLLAPFFWAAYSYVYFQLAVVPAREAKPVAEETTS